MFHTLTVTFPPLFLPSFFSLNSFPSFLLNCFPLFSRLPSFDGVSCSRLCLFLFSVFVLCWAVGFDVPPVFALRVQWENQGSPLGGKTGGGLQKDSWNGVQARLNWKTLEKLLLSLLSALLEPELRATDFVRMRHLATPLELELSKHSGKLPLLPCASQQSNPAACAVSQGVL